MWLMVITIMLYYNLMIANQMYTITYVDENKPTHWWFMCKWAKVRPLWHWSFLFLFFFLLSQRSSEARKHLVHKLPLICTEIIQASLTIINVLFSQCSHNYTLWKQKAFFSSDTHAFCISKFFLQVTHE